MKPQNPLILVQPTCGPIGCVMCTALGPVPFAPSDVTIPRMVAVPGPLIEPLETMPGRTPVWYVVIAPPPGPKRGMGIDGRWTPRLRERNP